MIRRILFSILFLFCSSAKSEGSKCMNEVCYPDYGNILIGRESQLLATSTCGVKGGERFCESRTSTCSVKGGERFCELCSECDSDPLFRDDEYKYHAIENVIKSNASERDGFWWQSENGVEEVAIQLDLESEMIITNILMIFRSEKPSEMVIERSRNFARSWYPYQYYSSNCSKSFPNVREGDRVNLTDVTCTSKYSKTMNETSGGLIFRVLPYGYSDAEASSGEMFNLLAATNLRIRFLKFGGQNVPREKEENVPRGKEENVLREKEENVPREKEENVTRESKESLFYSISKLYIRGSCSCFGHGDQCVPGEDEEVIEGKVYSKCNCVHNTEGPNCEMCKSSHNDVMWRPAEINRHNPCHKCECNNHSEHCHLDLMILDHSNGKSGGVCHDCQHNTIGSKCQACRTGFYRNPTKSIQDPEACLSCDCDPIGSMGSDCNNLDGQCNCKPGRTGRRCETDRNTI